MSKLNMEVIEEAVTRIIKLSQEKNRNFLETVELQIGLKNYDPSKDKRFQGVLICPNPCKSKLSVCVLGDQIHVDACEAAGVPNMGQEDMKALKKDKVKVKELAGKYDAFLASESIIRRIPRLLGPGLNKAGKFPGVLRTDEDVAKKIDEMKRTIKFQLKKVTCLSTSIGIANQAVPDIMNNIVLALNFLVSLLKKNWQNLKSVHIKTTMGPPERIF